MVSRLHKLHVKAKNVLGAVLIGNHHHHTVGKTHPWRLIFQFLKRPVQIGHGLNEYELTLWSKQFSRRFEGGLMTASFPQNIDRFNKDIGGKDNGPGDVAKPGGCFFGWDVVVIGIRG